MRTKLPTTDITITPGFHETSVLKARADRLAREHIQHGASSDSMLSVLEIGLGRERYALDTHYIREVHSVAGLTPIPCTPDFILGVVSIRGRICSVMDVRRLFGIPSGLLTDADKIILLHDGEMESSILASTVGMVKNIDMKTLSPWKPPGDESMVRFVEGLSPEGLLVLSAKTLLNDEYVMVNEDTLL